MLDVWHTKLRKSHKLAASLASLVDPVDSLLDRVLEIEPARLSVDGRGLVLANGSNHDDCKSMSWFDKGLI